MNFVCMSFSVLEEILKSVKRENIVLNNDDLDFKLLDPDLDTDAFTDLMFSRETYP